LRVYGLHHCLERAEDLMSSYHWGEWPDFFPIAFHRLPDRENMPVLDNSDFRITAWPVRHLIPTIGLRVQVKDSGKVLAYSSDTEPCSETVRLAAGADILIHEAAGDDVGHSSAAQAGTIAAEAGVKRLVLIHYKVWNTNPADTSALVEQACTTFEGPVELAQDFMEMEL
jgi:ribonuclease Z